MGKSIFEQMGGTYTLGEDGMYYPDLKLPTDEEPRYGKYGRIRKTFLQKHRYGLYLEFLLNSQLVLDTIAVALVIIITGQPAIERSPFFHPCFKRRRYCWHYRLPPFQRKEENGASIRMVMFPSCTLYSETLCGANSVSKR